MPPIAPILADGTVALCTIAVVAGALLQRQIATACESHPLTTAVAALLVLRVALVAAFSLVFGSTSNNVTYETIAWTVSFTTTSDSPPLSLLDITTLAFALVTRGVRPFCIRGLTFFAAAVVAVASVVHSVLVTLHTVDDHSSMAQRGHVIARALTMGTSSHTVHVANATPSTATFFAVGSNMTSALPPTHSFIESRDWGMASITAALYGGPPQVTMKGAAPIYDGSSSGGAELPLSLWKVMVVCWSRTALLILFFAFLVGRSLVFQHAQRLFKLTAAIASGEEEASIDATLTLPPEVSTRRAIADVKDCFQGTVMATLWRRWRGTFSFWSAVYLAVQMISFATPLLLRILVDELTKSDDSDSPTNQNTPTNTSDDGWSSSVGTGGDQRSKSSPDLRVVTVCLLGMIASAVVTTFLRAHYTLTLQGVAVHCRGLLTCAVFRRVLQQKAVTASSASGTTTNAEVAEDCGDSEQPISSGLAPTAAAAINHDDDDDGEAVALNADHRHLPCPSSPAGAGDGARSRKDEDADRASVDRAYGAVATHVTVDVFRIADQIPNFNDLWALPLQAALALGLLYLQVSFAFLGGLALAVLLVPVNVYLAKKIGAVNGKLMKANDERVTRLDESLSNIVAVKSTGDTARIVEWIMQPRREYFKQLTWLKLLDAWCVFFWATTPIFVSVVTFMTYSWVMGRELTAGRAVAALALFANLIAPLNAYPWVVNGATEAFVSQRRLTAFLQDLKVESPWAVGDTAGQSRGEHWPRPQSPRHSGTQPRLSNASNPPVPELEHSARSSGVPSPLLGGTRNSSGVHGPHGVSVTAIMPLPRGVRPRGAPSSALQFEGFTIAPGHVTVVAGGSGAGKSLALLALLGEVDGGSASVLGHPVAYLPQQPLLVRGSVKENIIFDRLFDPAALDEAVRRACLTRDCTLWPDGLETSVGEDGKALSGGQRTRVNLARALYGALLPPPQDMLHQSARSSRSAVVDVYGSLEHSPSLSSPPQPGALFPPAPQGTGCRYLVLDDPFASLDAATTRFILRSAVFGLAAERNIAVIVATHHELFSSGPPQPAPCNVFEVAQGRLTLIVSVEPSAVAGLIEAPALQACEGDEALIAVEAGNIEARAKESDLGHVDSGDSAPAATAGLQQTDLKHSGTVAVQAARSYTAHVGVLFSVAVVVSLVLMQAVRNGNDCFVAWWTTSGDSLDFFIKGLAVFAAGNACFALTRSFAFAFAGLRAARATHDQLLDSVFAASMAFFHDVSAAAVVNRLSQDVYNVDDPFPFTLNIVMAQLFLLIGAIAVIFVNSSPFVLFVIPPVAVAFFFLQRPYRKATRELKRVESATRTPILDVVKMFCDGAASLRAEGRASLERREAQAVLSLDGLQRSNWSLSVLGAWFGLRLQLIGAAILACVAVAVLAIVAVADGGTASVSAASLGLAVAYVGPLSGNLSALLGSFTELEKLMISVERIDDYCGAEPEAQALHLQDADDASYLHQPGRGAVLPLPGEGIAAPGASYNNVNVWPSQGTIEIANCRVVFGAHVALSIPTLRINAGEKVAVVGRTGAGKSTFVNALLGLVTPQAIDGAAPCRVVVDGCELFAPLPEAALHGGCASNNASSHGLQTLPRVDHAATTATPLLSVHDQHGDQQSTGGGKRMQTKTRTFSSGDVLGVDVLRRAAAVLPQKPFVWHGTVASNVDPDGAMAAADIDAALAFVGLTKPCDDASDEHALSAKTVLEEHGKNISLGEQHLLAFARFWATRPDPVVTLMDEPGSAVGHEACDRLMRCVLRRAGTCVVVTHSLRTIGEYDRVLVLDGGRVVEDGAPSALLSDSASRLSQLAAA